ncbi:FkbM family methyltransferase [Salmonella enterica subsp. enterica serovar Typhimurium]|uniref:FkbM family methyltransferase n=1 Tax=Salmonella typhimurium TaxID=90371 RepID=A0A627VTA1_SALTM|nr:FkbM family methyltransferase [Salmonella enterica subsp. enterica serovar Typhimurium]EHG3609725.1 FkbM family methyltransferase [Salmonella enterica subsp. enterica serovar Typhimurium]
MNFLTLLDETNNHFIDTIDKMKQNGKPLVLFGAGFLGQMTWEFLQRQNVTIDLVALNEKYLTVDFSFNEIPVVTIEKLLAGSERYNYIIALQVINDDVLQPLNSSAEDMLVFDPSFIGINTEEYYSTDFCHQHSEALSALYDELADEKSRQTMVAFINQRICAKRRYYHAVYDSQHYFSHDVVQLKDNEVFVDAGAYTGDSVAAFMSEVDRQNVSLPQHIVACEPDSNSFAMLIQNTRHMDFCESINKGVWDKKSQLRFQSGKAQSSRICEENESTTIISLDCIDDILHGGVATFIKMDVEGAELKALIGASQTIKKYNPLLAISVYHKPNDLIAIPEYIKSLSHAYKFYLRAHHPELAFDLVLYAVPIDRALS